jgi:hypothetical protein
MNHVDIYFGLNITVLECNISKPRERMRKVRIHINAIEDDNPPGTLEFATRIANRIGRLFDEMHHPCELEITGKGVAK